MSDMKCPFCQQKLVYDSGIEQWCCDKCHLSGGYKLWKVLINTRKALDIAVDEIKKIKVAAESVGIGFFMTAAIFALEKIKTALEQKD